MIVIENIDRFCANQGISIVEFEKRCKLGHSSVGKWRRGIASPSVKTLQKISDATNIPMENWLKSEGL